MTTEHHTEHSKQAANFEHLIKDEHILKAIKDLGFTEPTPIQTGCIPLIQHGKDLIGQAKTGSGKTFAFGIPILERIEPGHHIQALIIAPTRELCQQITLEIKKMAKYKKTRVAAVYGGVSINPQIDQLRDAQIVAGTPGRLLDHLERGTLDPTRIRTVVLDEADRMFDMGFIEDMERIMQAVPNDRQTLLFSATMPDAIKRLTHKYQRNPEHIKTASHVEEHLLPQFYAVVEHNKKFSLLVHLIQTEDPKLGIIFCGTRHIAETVARNLQRNKVSAESLHGGLSQAKRDRVVQDFKAGKVHMLIATDVAARGLDIKNVTHVFNYDVPKNPEDYVHRIGRTARAGEAGKAITLLENRDFEFFQNVLSLPNVNPKEMHVTDFKSIGFQKHSGEGFGDRDQRSGGFGGRGPRRGFGGPRREGGSYGGGSSYSGQRRESSGQRSEGREGGEFKRGGSGGWKTSKRAR